MRRDIDEALHGWPYDPEPGEVVAREVRARDGRMILQIRARPRPPPARDRGAGPTASGRTTSSPTSTTSRHRAAARGAWPPGGKAPSWSMEPVHCRAEADREFAQYLPPPRVAWLAAASATDRALRERRPHARA